MNDIKLDAPRFAETSGLSPEAAAQRPLASEHDVERFASIMERQTGDGAGGEHE